LVLTTESDIKFPLQATRTVAASKAESGDTSFSFGGTNPSFGQFTLTAYTNGVNVPVSIELAADVDALAPFVTMDLSRGIANWEESMFIGGSGSGQPQGVMGNTSGTITESLTTQGVDAVLDLTGEVNPFYYPNASFLMNRLTGIQFQKAQLALNQFQNFWSRTGTQDYLLGYPVEYSYEMPVYGSASPPSLGTIIFGDFKSGYVIGDRHSSSITARVLTEVGALQGIINILGYRRSDGRVRRSEALAQLNING
jgi:HK97 family phage major capsid protein